MGCESCTYHSGQYWPSCGHSKSNQNTRGNASRGPEHGHAFRLYKQPDAKVRCQEIAKTNCRREPNVTSPLPSHIMGGWLLALAACQQTLSHPLHTRLIVPTVLLDTCGKPAA